ncbi:MAG: hypothetical protein ACOYM9_11480 [Bradymonadia bacterium]
MKWFVRLLHIALAGFAVILTNGAAPSALASAPSASKALIWPPLLRLGDAKRCTRRDLEWSNTALGPVSWREPSWTKPQSMQDWLRDLLRLVVWGPTAAEDLFGIGTVPRRIYSEDGFVLPRPARTVERGGRTYSVLSSGTLYYGWWTEGVTMMARSLETPRQWAVRSVRRSLDRRSPEWTFDGALKQMRSGSFRPGDRRFTKSGKRKYRAEFDLEYSPDLGESLSRIEVDYGPPHLTRPDGIATYSLVLVHEGQRVTVKPGDCVEVLDLDIPMTLALIEAWTELEPRDIPFEERIAFIEFRLWAHPPRGP